MATEEELIQKLTNAITPVSERDPRENFAPQQDFQLTLEEMIIQDRAEKDAKVAKAKAEASSIEFGTPAAAPRNMRKVAEYVLPERQGAVTTVFGGEGKIRTRADGRRVLTIEKEIVDDKPTPQAAQQVLNTTAIARAAAKGTRVFDIETELKNMRSLSGTERQDAAIMLMGTIAQQMGSRQNELRMQAAQRSGVEDAKSSLEKILALENAAKAQGRMRPGDTSYQLQEAQQNLLKAQQISNQWEMDFIKSDPALIRLTTYQKLIERDVANVDKQLTKAAALDANLPVFTPQRLTNVKYAYGIDTDDMEAIKKEVRNSYYKDKALQKVIDADKTNITQLLVDIDPAVRKMAYQILTGYEQEIAGKDMPLPGYVKALEKLIKDPNAIYEVLGEPQLSKQLSTQVSMASGQKEKDAVRTQHLTKATDMFVEQIARNKYQNMGGWVFTDQRIKPVIDGALALSGKDQRVLMRDGVEAVIKAEIKNPDGTMMSFEEKRKALSDSLAASLDNDRQSFLLPDTALYKEQLMYALKNQITNAFIRYSMATAGLTFSPLAPNISGR